MAQAVELNGKKILVTFLMHLGDLTLTTPFIHARVRQHRMRTLPFWRMRS